jgi:hypothetical protein
MIDYAKRVDEGGSSERIRRHERRRILYRDRDVLLRMAIGEEQASFYEAR